MIWKILLFLGCVYVVFGSENPSQNELDSVLASAESAAAKIKDESFTYLSSFNTQFLKNTPKPQNVQYSPFILQIVMSMMQLKLQYTALASASSSDKTIEAARTLSEVLESLKNTPGTYFNASPAVFADQDVKSLETYVGAVKKYYNSEIIRLSFDSNKNVLKTINDWIFEKTKGRQPPLDALPAPLLFISSLELGVLSFKSCWIKPKFISAQKQKFRAENGEVDVETIESKELLGYGDFAHLKVEAIRLPYQRGEFAASVILPYESETLNVFHSFTAQDYEIMLTKISSNSYEVDYKIPSLNLALITFNENGTVLNGEPVISCESSSDGVAVAVEAISNEFSKRFIVDRPYALLIYHERTKAILYSVFVRNPIYGVLSYRQFEGEFRSKNDEIQFVKKSK